MAGRTLLAVTNGRIPDLLAAAGFTRPVEMAHEKTPFGDLYDHRSDRAD